MKEVMRTNDLVRLSWAEAVLADAGLACVQMDVHASAIEGSIAAIQRRLMVPDEDYARALDALNEAGAFDESG